MTKSKLNIRFSLTRNFWTSLSRIQTPLHTNVLGDEDVASVDMVDNDCPLPMGVDPANRFDVGHRRVAEERFVAMRRDAVHAQPRVQDHILETKREAIKLENLQVIVNTVISQVFIVRIFIRTAS